MRSVGQRLMRFLRENWLLLLVVGLVAVGFLVLRTPASAVASIAEAEAILEDGRPTLVEFYSNT